MSVVNNNNKQSSILEDLDSMRITIIPCNLQTKYSLTNIPNVWGLKNAINHLTLPKKTIIVTYHYKGIELTHETTNTTQAPKNRQALITTLKKTNSILTVLGYIPGLSTLTGLIRLMFANSLEDKIENGIKDQSIKGPYVDETRWTVRGQKIRACLELIPLIGQLVNAALDYHYYKYRGKGIPTEL